MFKKLIVLVLSLVLAFSCLVVNSSAMTWQDDPDLSGYVYSTPLNFNFNSPGYYSISCSSPYVEFYDFAFYEGIPIQWIAYDSSEFLPGVSSNWLTYCTNEFSTSGVQWSDPSPRSLAYGEVITAFPYIYFDSLEMPDIMVNSSFESIGYVRFRFEQSLRLFNTVTGTEEFIAMDEYVDVSTNQFDYDLIINPVSITSFDLTVLEFADQMEIDIEETLYDMGYSEDYIDSVSMRDFIAYDNYQCVMTMGYVGTVGGVPSSVEYGNFWIGSDVDFVLPAYSYNVQLMSSPEYLDFPYSDAFRVDDFDHSRWFSWIGTALSGFMNAPLFRFGSINVTIGLIFFSIVAVFGLFFVFRAFAGG